MKYPTATGKGLEKLLATGTVLTNENVHTFHKNRGTLFAFRYTTVDGRSPLHPDVQPQLVCAEDVYLQVPQASTDWSKDCAAGVSVATHDWVFRHINRRPSIRTIQGMRRYQTTHGFPIRHRVWLVRFESEDIACISRYSDGKIRLFRCSVVQEVTRSPFTGLTRKTKRGGKK